jgi:DUF4097 and DUF4098 domain-containing protein YvlB
MKLNSLIISAALFCSLAFAASASAQKAAGGEAQPGNERTVTAAESVNVTVSTGTGKIIVHGWDRQEVRARVEDEDARVELRNTDGANGTGPALRVEVLVSDSADEEPQYGVSIASADVQVDVPRGATVYLKTQDGDIEVDGVAEARIETIDGEIEVVRVAKAIDATSVGGDMTVENSAGRVRLNSIGGSISAREIRSTEPSDFLKAKTVSGDLTLDRIGQTHVETNTISGEVRLNGPLARGGSYDFTTTTGDITLAIPNDSSFKINARVSEGGEIITEFPLHYKSEGPPAASILQSGRLSGSFGTGDATINLISFSGTVRLRRK